MATDIRYGAAVQCVSACLAFGKPSVHEQRHEHSATGFLSNCQKVFERERGEAVLPAEEAGTASVYPMDELELVHGRAARARVSEQLHLLGRLCDLLQPETDVWRLLARRRRDLFCEYMDYAPVFREMIGADPHSVIALLDDIW